MKTISKPIGFFIAAIVVLMTGACAKGDQMPPEITVIGNTHTISYKGVTYVDQGATAMDNIDLDITSKIVVSGSVGTAVGNYTITYSVADAAGNHAETYRHVKVTYGNTYLVGTYNVVETSPFGTVTYTGSVTASTTDPDEFVFGSTSAPDPIVVDATITSLDQISILLVAQGGPISNFTGTISEPSSAVVFNLSYLRPINNTTTNCTAVWTKQ
jgi:hypothetical protein